MILCLNSLNNTLTIKSFEKLTNQKTNLLNEMNNIPNFIRFKISVYTLIDDIKELAFVNWAFYRVIKNNYFWKTKFELDHKDLIKTAQNMDLSFDTARLPAKISHLTRIYNHISHIPTIIPDQTATKEMLS